MSEQLTVLNNNVLAVGGIGLGTGIFKPKAQFLELVQKTTRAEGAQPGKYRNTATNEHWDEMRVVLLSVPQEQREYYDNSQGFSKDSKVCFSLTNVQPHARAKEPQAMYCATCTKGDKNWEVWRKTHDPKDLPACNMFYAVLLADRATQTVFRFNVKGTSVMPFKSALETQAAGLLQKIMADVRAKNKTKGYFFVPKTGLFVPIEGTVPTDAPLPMPNIFDISFCLFVTTRDKGGPPVVGCKDFKYMSPEDRAEFGALYLEYTKQPDPTAVAAEEEAQQVAAAVSAPPVQTIVLPGPATVPTVTGVTEVLTGEIVGKDEPITI
jgi:hypothetical protein